MPFTSRQILMAASAALGLGAVAFGGYKASTLLTTPVLVTLEAEAGCDLQRGPCSALLPQGGRVVLTVTPRPIPLIKPIMLDVEISGLDPGKVEADISTVDMYMGLNRRELRALGDHRYTMQTMLGACTRETMRWRFTVLMRDGRTTYSAPFEFETRSGKANDKS